MLTHRVDGNWVKSEVRRVIKSWNRVWGYSSIVRNPGLHPHQCIKLGMVAQPAISAFRSRQVGYQEFKVIFATEEKKSRSAWVT